ncbi:MAG: hypothetical protein XD95_0649 [Microgenomates bacterium 39_7]|nr:MAG: hypothetical protein XD95_0649 [Microgenomates bacterium 39_7]
MTKEFNVDGLNVVLKKAHQRYEEQQAATSTTESAADLSTTDVGLLIAERLGIEGLHSAESEPELLVTQLEKIKDVFQLIAQGISTIDHPDLFKQLNLNIKQLSFLLPALDQGDLNHSALESFTRELTPIPGISDYTQIYQFEQILDEETFSQDLRASRFIALVKSLGLKEEDLISSVDRLAAQHSVPDSLPFHVKITRLLATAGLAVQLLLTTGCFGTVEQQPTVTAAPTATPTAAESEAESEGEADEETELFNPQDFDYQNIRAGGQQTLSPSQSGLEITPLPTSVTPNQEQEQEELNQMIERLEPVLVELLAQREWRENTSIDGVLLRIDGENKVAAKIITGGSSDGEINQGDVVFLQREGDQFNVEIYSHERSPEEISLDEIKNQLEVINRDLQEGKLVLSESQEGVKQLFYHVDGQEILVGELTYENNQLVIVRNGATHQFGALQVVGGELVITTREGGNIEVYERKVEVPEEEGVNEETLQEKSQFLELGPVEESEIFDHSRFRTAYEGTSSDGVTIRLAYDENQRTLKGQPFFPFPVEIGYVEGTGADGEPIINNDAFADTIVDWMEHVRDGRQLTVVDASILKRLIENHKSSDSLINTLSDPDILKTFDVAFRSTDKNGNSILNREGEPIKVIDEVVLYYQGAEHAPSYVVPPEYRQFEVLSKERDDLMVSATVGRGTSDVPSNYLISIFEKSDGNTVLLVKCFDGAQQGTVDRPNSEYEDKAQTYKLFLALIDGITSSTWPSTYIKTSGNSMLGGRTHVVRPDSVKQHYSKVFKLLVDHVYKSIIEEGILDNLANR